MAQLIKKSLETKIRRAIKFSGGNAGRLFFRRTLVAGQTPSAGQAKTLAQTYPEPERELKWLFPASTDAEEIHYAHKHSSGLTGGCLRFFTKKPLKPEHMERALDIWQRKIPNFSCRMTEHDGQLWICYDPNQKGDFDVLEEDLRQETIDRFCSDPKQSTETPSWIARLLRASDNFPCAVPGIEDNFPYQYELLLSFHHSFLDGTTTAIAFQKLTEILNDIIAGRHIDDQPSAIYISDEDIQKLNAKIIRQLEDDPIKLQEIREETLACNNSPILYKAFPPPGGEDHSRTVIHNINQQALQRFYADCKKAGVTINSGFEAIINTALVEMIRDAGVEDISHQISVNLAFDSRRYMKQYELPIVGLHRRHHTHRVQTSVNVRNHFWPYTQKLHKRLSGMIRSGEVMQQHVVRQMTMPKTSLDEYYKGNPAILRDYLLSNLGEVTKTIPGEGDHLQLIHISIFNGMIKCPYLMIHNIHSLRGHSPYGLSYNRNCISDDTAGQFMERVVNLLENYPQ